MADNFNHSNIKTVSEIVTKTLHLQADQESSYFTQTKYMNNYSPIFSAKEIEENK